MYVEDALGRTKRDDEYSPSVAIGHACDALILAVDALCHATDTPAPRRHDEGQRVFLDLIRDGKIPESAAQWRDFLIVANHQRAGFQYHGELTSRSEAQRFVKKAAAFVAFVRAFVTQAG